MRRRRRKEEEKEKEKKFNANFKISYSDKSVGPIVDLLSPGKRT